MASATTTEMVTMNVSPSFKCWRMIYSGTKVVRLFERKGVTKTQLNLFCSDPTDGTTEGFVTSAAGQQECLQQALALNLMITV